MKKRKLVLLDCDDILLDYIEGFKLFINEHYNINPVGMPKDYSLYQWLEISQFETIEMMKHFNQKSFEFGTLKPIDETTIHYVNKLCIENKDDTDFIVVTKSGTFGHGEVLRKANLMNVFGDIFTDIIILEGYESKLGTFNKLNQYYDIVCVVDDFIGNIDDAHKLGLDTVILHRSHNEFQFYNPEYNFVLNWEEMYNYINYKIKNS